MCCAYYVCVCVCMCVCVRVVCTMCMYVCMCMRHLKATDAQTMQRDFYYVAVVNLYESHVCTSLYSAIST